MRKPPGRLPECERSLGAATCRKAQPACRRCGVGSSSRTRRPVARSSSWVLNYYSVLRTSWVYPSRQSRAADGPARSSFCCGGSSSPGQKKRAPFSAVPGVYPPTAAQHRWWDLMLLAAPSHGGTNHGRPKWKDSRRSRHPLRPLLIHADSCKGLRPRNLAVGSRRCNPGRGRAGPPASPSVASQCMTSSFFSLPNGEVRCIPGTGSLRSLVLGYGQTRLTRHATTHTHTHTHTQLFAHRRSSWANGGPGLFPTVVTDSIG